VDRIIDLGVDASIVNDRGPRLLQRLERCCCPTTREKPLTTDRADCSCGELTLVT
jgi:hypothetical protein